MLYYPVSGHYCDLPFGQEAPSHFRPAGFGASAPVFSQHAHTVTLHSTGRLCGSAFEQENRPEGLDIYLSCISTAPGTPRSVHKNPLALVLNPEAFRDNEVILESSLCQLLKKQMDAESTREPFPPIFCLAIVKNVLSTSF